MIKYESTGVRGLSLCKRWNSWHKSERPTLLTYECLHECRDQRLTTQTAEHRKLTHDDRKQTLRSDVVTLRSRCKAPRVPILARAALMSLNPTLPLWRHDRQPSPWLRRSHAGHLDPSATWLSHHCVTSLTACLNRKNSWISLRCFVITPHICDASLLTVFYFSKVDTEGPWQNEQTHKDKHKQSKLWKNLNSKTTTNYKLLRKNGSNPCRHNAKLLGGQSGKANRLIKK